MSDINKLYYYQEMLKAIRADKLISLKTYEGLIDILADSKASIREKLSEHFTAAQLGTKKNAGIEMLELWIVNKQPDLKEAYKNYIKYSLKEKYLGRVLDSYNSDISSVQSEMKFYPPDPTVKEGL